MCSNTVYVQNPDIALREEDESGSLLFNPDSGEVLVINDTGRFIWDLCEKGSSISKIVKQFNKEYENLPENLEEEISDYLTIMTKGAFVASS
ncbi:MAG: PqqD family peptide modification chaperone [Candidatus Sabulitectum sp.]|nr:PqqD family peptide modification chaperone [Candidatus Sabulitectum sp.]